MYLHAIVVYFLLLWWPDEPPVQPEVTSLAGSILCAVGYILLVGALEWIWAVGSKKRTRLGTICHIAGGMMPVLAVSGMACLLFLTRWPAAVESLEWITSVPALAETIMLVPYFLAVCLIWAASYPAERQARLYALQRNTPPGQQPDTSQIWSFWQYLIFQFRHQMLMIIIPMTLILIALDLSERHSDALVSIFRIPWVEQLVLAVAGITVFLLAPVLLRYLWSTKPLQPGPLRDSLEAICKRYNLKYREILIWNSHGMVGNAAVMGIAGPLRYILLSDALIENMDRRKIEAVFGHEAAHVRHRHIPYFLLFGAIGLLITSGVMEIFLRLSYGKDAVLSLTEANLQTIGFVTILLFWGFGFGRLSRLFERQADVEGARCVQDLLERCPVICERHTGQPDEPIEAASPENPVPGNPDALCATASAIFASALDNVAVINGIPHAERNWRHGSIRTRMQQMAAFSQDVALVTSFDKQIRKVKRLLWVATILGLVIMAVYVVWHPAYRDLLERNLIDPFRDTPENTMPVPPG